MNDKEDEQYFFEQGEVFLFPSRHLYYADGGSIYSLCVPAFTVCESFATEAYLKSLIKIESRSAAPRTHNLKKLFDLLRTETQIALKAEWLANHAWSVLNVKYGDAPDGTPFEAKVPESFEEALELSAQAFLKWRYDFLDHHAWHMRALGYIIRRQILVLKPEWRPEFGSYFSRLDPHPDFVKAKPEQSKGSTATLPGNNYQTPTYKFQNGRWSFLNHDE